MKTDEQDGWIWLPTPPAITGGQRRRLSEAVRVLANDPLPSECLKLVEAVPLSADAATRAAISILADLVVQGWALAASRGGVWVRPPAVESDATNEKERVRRQELWKRDEQLRKASVRKFVQAMESPRIHNDRFVSIFDLMRSGDELANRLKAVRQTGLEDTDALRQIIDPYVQVVDSTGRCEFTGLRLLDVWRYFRHTWINQYSTTPGRTMMLLVRDRAAAHHPVIGIAALASPIVQISERDDWIGWQPEKFVEAMSHKPSKPLARWIMERLELSRNEIHLADLIGEGLYWPALWTAPEEEAIGRLRKEAESRRRDHARFARVSSHKKAISDDDQWIERAESDLFRSKRAGLLADLLAARRDLLPFLGDVQSREELTLALNDPHARRAILGIVRRAKGETVGTEIADLSVCGAIPPYGALLGGKLVSMLAVSPTVARAYHDKYSKSPSEIASAIAGRPIYRRSNLAYVGTTSLFGSGSSQYNRVKIPVGVLTGSTDVIEYNKLGRSKSYGTSHLSTTSMNSLVTFAEQKQTGRRINSIFGEGVNPKLRKVREALDTLGWPSDALLRHGRERIVYGVPLVSNLLPYLLGFEKRPRFVFDLKAHDDVAQVGDFWLQRWLSPRIRRDDVLNDVARHTLDRPVVHGARVPLQDAAEEHR